MSENATVLLQALHPGDAVEVRCSFDEAWKRGFEVDSLGDGGYRIRRLSDGSVLPIVFSAAVVRPCATAR